MNKMDTIIKGPVRYDKHGQMIFDSNSNLICDIRGWGRIQYMSNPEEKQDGLGKFIADAINEKIVNSHLESLKEEKCLAQST